MAEQQQAQNRPLRLSHGRTQMSAVAPAQAQRMRTNGVYYLSDNLVTIGTFVANNWGYIDIPTGRYTYRQWGFSLTATAVIAGETDTRNGVHYVKTSFISKYVDTFIIEIDGKAKWELTADELMKLNAYQNHDTSEGVLRFAFGNPLIHNTDMVEDAYQFGTGNVRSVKLRVKTKAAWLAGMMPKLNVEYAPVQRPVGYFQSTTRYSYTNPGTGNYTITDLAAGLDFATIWVQSANVNRLKFTVDRDIVFDQDNWSLKAMHDAWGKDVSGLGAGAIFDTFRDGDGIGLDSVTDELGERRRGADIRLDLDMAAASQTINIVVFHCGLYASQ